MTQPKSCDNCGVCCLGLGTPPFLGFEILKLPKNLKAEVLEKGFGSEREGQACYWLDQGICTQYENRPQLCRDFEIGSDSCLSIRKFYGII